MKEKRLTAKQNQCLQWLCEGSLTQKEIAQQLHVSEQTICNWKKDELFMTTYDHGIRKRIRYTAGKALAKQVELLDGEDSKVAHWAASDLLDRAGFKPEDKLNLSGGVGVTIIDDLGADDDTKTVV